MGLLGTVGSGVMQPLNMLIFGTLTGDIVSYATLVFNNTVTEEDKQTFFDNIVKFVFHNCLIGVGMFVFSYTSTVVFNYSALRQAFKVRSLFFEKTMNQDVGWFDINQTGDFASRMSE